MFYKFLILSYFFSSRHRSKYLEYFVRKLMFVVIILSNFFKGTFFLRKEIPSCYYDTIASIQFSILFFYSSTGFYRVWHYHSNRYSRPSNLIVPLPVDNVSNPLHINTQQQKKWHILYSTIYEDFKLQQLIFIFRL
jgi:hypothetical protein